MRVQFAGSGQLQLLECVMSDAEGKERTDAACYVLVPQGCTTGPSDDNTLNINLVQARMVRVSSVRRDSQVPVSTYCNINVDSFQVGRHGAADVKSQLACHTAGRGSLFSSRTADECPSTPWSLLTVKLIVKARSMSFHSVSIYVKRSLSIYNGENKDAVHRQITTCKPIHGNGARTD